MPATIALRPDARYLRRSAPSVTEPQLFYAPPYANPSEDALAWALVRALKSDCGLRYQIPEGVNFMIETPSLKVAILIDADAGHAAVPADVIYSVSSEDLKCRLADVMYTISLLDPRLFEGSERAKIRRHASPNLAIEFDGDDLTGVRLRYEPEEHLVEIDGEWIVLDPADSVYETRITRLAR